MNDSESIPLCSLSRALCLGKRWAQCLSAYVVITAFVEEKACFWRYRLSLFWVQSPEGGILHSA